MYKTVKRLALGAVALLATMVAFGSGTVAQAASQTFTYTISSAATPASPLGTRLYVPLSATAASGDELVVFTDNTVPSGNSPLTPTISAYTGVTSGACSGTATSFSTQYNTADGSRTKVSYGWLQITSAEACVEIDFNANASASASVVDITPGNAGTFTQLATISSDTSQCDCTGQDWNSTTNSRAVNVAFVAGYSVEGAYGATTSGTNWTVGSNAQSLVSNNKNNSQADAESVAASGSSDALTEYQTNGSSEILEQNALTELIFKCV